MTTLPRTGRAARRGLLLTALLSGGLLVGGAVLSWTGAREVGAALDRGQGDLHVQALHQGLSGGPPTDEQLADVVAQQQDEGLLFVGLVDGDRTLVSAGTPAGSLTGLSRVDGRVRMVHRPPGRPDGRPPGPPDLLEAGPGSAPPRGPLGVGPEASAPPDGPPGGPPGLAPPGAAPHPPRGHLIVLEFEPRLSSSLQAQADRQLALSILAALLLAGAAGVFWRQSVRAEEAEAALADAERLAALGEMSAVLAHEIRNPLAALKGHAQLVAEQLDGQRAQRSAHRVVQGAERLEALANDLLDFVRSGAVDLAEHDPAALLRAVAEDHPGVSLVLDDAPSAWTFDRARMRQVLDNLLANARQASEDVEAAVSIDGDELVFAVRDRGPGVPGDASQLFEPFHTTKTRGVGLGLAVCKRIATAHGGRIAATNRDGGGAEFFVALPASAPSSTL